MSAGVINHAIARGLRKLVSAGPGEFVIALRRTLRDRWRTRNWMTGRLAELRGNRVRLRGVMLHFDNPHISTTLKSLFVSGAYEEEEAAAIIELLPRDMPVIELGACIGFIACLTNQLLLDRTKHVVVEANSQLLPTLEKNRDANGCAFSIVHAALAYGSETIEFPVHANFYSSGFGRQSQQVERVPVVSVRKLLERAGFDRASLIVDIEGAEASLLQNELDVLRDRVGLLFIEIHDYILGPSTAADLVRRLSDAGFETIYHNKCQYVLRNRAVVSVSA